MPPPSRPPRAAPFPLLPLFPVATRACLSASSLGLGRPGPLRRPGALASSPYGDWCCLVLVLMLQSLAYAALPPHFKRLWGLASVTFADPSIVALLTPTAIV